MRFESELRDLKRISYLVGSNSDLIQGSGGNTSFKNNKYLWVKASGTALKDAQKKEIFLQLNLQDAQLSANETLEKNFRFEPINNSTNLRASIETAIHAIMPYKYVVHTHPIEVIANAVYIDSFNIFSKILNEFNWSWIPYCRPGLPLAKHVSKTLVNQNSDILILQNHGLVIASNEADKILETQDRLLKLLEVTPRKYIFSKNEELNNVLSQLKKKGINARTPQQDIIHSLVLDEFSFQIAMQNPLYPDHLVFCGKTPLVLEKNDIGNITLLERHSYILIKNIGVILLEGCTSAIEDMLLNQAKVLLRLNSIDQLVFLTNSDCNELVNWEAEKYRKELDNKSLIEK